VANLVKLGQTWSNLVKLGQTWSNLVKLGQTWQIRLNLVNGTFSNLRI